MKKIFILNLIMISFIYGEANNTGSKWRYRGEVESVNLNVDADVIVPLEIITDLEVNATVVDDQRLEVPFILKMNKKPEKEYKINYSENVIDIDNDGRNDVEIQGQKYVTSQIVKNNKIIIEGKNIKKEGTYTKRVYISVEIKDGGKR